MRRIKPDLLHGVIWQQLLLFFFPVFFGTLFQQLYNTVDAVVVGNFVGKEALGAVGGSTGTVINLLVGFVTGLSSGATVVIAQFYGSNDPDGVERGVYSGMFLAVVLGFALMFTGFFIAPVMLTWLRVPADIYPLSLLYMRIYMSGMVPAMIYNTGAGVLRAVGDSRRPLYFLIASCIVNIILDVVFVAVMHWGVSGVAAATVISQVCSCLLTLYVLYRTDDSYHFDLRRLHFEPKTLRRILLIGFPSGIQSCLYSVSNLFIQAGINMHGTDTVAAYTAFGKIDALFWNSSGALGTPLLTFAGQNFGAGNIERVRKGIREGTVLFMIISTVITVLSYFGGPFLFRLFTPDAEVTRIGLSILRYICPLWFTFVFVEVLSSSIRACGDTLYPMLMTAAGIGILRILWILLYPAETIFDTLRCYPISWALTSVLFLVYYLHGGWLKRCMNVRQNMFRRV